MHVGLGLLTLFPGRVGGVETYVQGLLGQYVAGRGPERVTVLANRHVETAYAPRLGGPVDLRRVRSYRAGDSIPTRALAMAAARVAPAWVARDVPAGLDVLHHAVTVPIPRFKGPTVTTIHEVQVHERPEVFSAAERRFRRWAYDGSARHATVTVAISHYIAERLVGLLGLDPDRVEVVHYGVDHERFRPDPAPGDERLALPARFVFYPANVWAHKNHERLLEAFARVGDDELALVLAGQDYGQWPRLRELAARLGVAPRVHHLGHLGPLEVPAVLRRARALVFPSLYEGFGAPPLEAMACGLPVASSTRASLAEVCGDAVEALDPEDAASIAAAIERVTTDEDRRAQLRERGLAHAARFHWRTAANRHAEVYAKALALHGRT